MKQEYTKIKEKVDIINDLVEHFDDNNDGLA